MKEFYISRKIDDLGRIVIPKSIRKELSIRSNDDLDIKVKGNEIIICKSKVSDIYLNSIKKIYNSVNKLFDGVLFFTDLEKIVLSTKEYLINQKICESKFIDCLDNRTKYISNNIENILMDLTGYIYILPIISNSNIYGLMCLISKEKYNIFDLELLIKIIENDLEIC